MSAISVQNNMDEQDTVSGVTTFKKRNIRSQASRKRKGSEEDDSTYYEEFLCWRSVQVILRFQKNACCMAPYPKFSV